MFIKKRIIILASMALILFLCTLPLQSNAAGKDNTPPQLRSTSINGNLLVLSYNESLNTTSVPAAGTFTIKINGVQRTGIISNTAISGSNVNITLNITVMRTDTVLLSYTPGTNPIKDLTGNLAAAFSNQQIMNNTPDISPPELTNAIITGTLITVSYNEDLNASSVPAAEVFTIKVNGVQRTGIISNTAISGSNVSIILNITVTRTDTVLLSYTPGTNPIKDLAGNPAVGFSDRQLAYKDITAPVLTTAAITGTLISVIYDEDLDITNTPAANDFTVKINGVQQVGIISSTAISGNNVSITLNITVMRTDTVLLSYTPGTNPIKDLAGNLAAGFSNQPIINNTITSMSFNFTTIKDKTFYTPLTVNNAVSFTGKTYTLTYDSLFIEPIDLCAITYANETSYGIIPGTGITITNVSPGSIIMTVDKTIPNGKPWSGIINVLKFKAKISGETSITVKFN